MCVILHMKLCDWQHIVSVLRLWSRTPTCQCPFLRVAVILIFYYNFMIFKQEQRGLNIEWVWTVSFSHAWHCEWSNVTGQGYERLMSKSFLLNHIFIKKDSESWWDNGTSDKPLHQTFLSTLRTRNPIYNNLY